MIDIPLVQAAIKATSSRQKLYWLKQVRKSLRASITHYRRAEKTLRWIAAKNWEEV